MDDIDTLIPETLKTAIRTHGLDKVASHMYGVQTIDEKTAATIIGTKLAARRAEWTQIMSGLQALKDLER